MDAPEERCTAGAEPLPLVTIITPTFNRADLIEETISSVLAQDYPRIEYLVLDDGSTDHTPAVLERFQETFPDRFRWARHDNAGQARTINRGFSLARGELIGLVSSDDPLPRGVVSGVASVLRANPEILVAYPDVEIIDENGERIGEYRTLDYSYTDMLRWHECAPSAGLIFRRSVVARAGGWDPSFRYVPDFDFFLRVGLLGPFRRVPEVRAAYRWHSGALSHAEQGEVMAREHVRVLEKLFARPDLPDEVRAVRSEAFRNAHILAGLIAASAPDGPGHRFQPLDQYSPVQMRWYSDSSDDRAQIAQLGAEISRRHEVIEALRNTADEREALVRDYEGDALRRESRVTSLRAQVAAGQATVKDLQESVAEKTEHIAQLQACASDEDRLIAELQQRASGHARLIADLNDVAVTKARPSRGPLPRPSTEEYPHE